MEDLEAAATLAFHGVAYVVTVGVERQELCVQVEVEDAAAPQDACWTARFPSDCAARSLLLFVGRSW